MMQGMKAAIINLVALKLESDSLSCSLNLIFFARWSTGNFFCLHLLNM